MTRERNKTALVTTHDMGVAQELCDRIGIIKNGELDGVDFNDSTLNVTGMAIAHGNWYIYIDYAISDGNAFVGNKGDIYGTTYAESSVGDVGANDNNRWNHRFNINFGYYF